MILFFVIFFLVFFLVWRFASQTVRDGGEVEGRIRKLLNETEHSSASKIRLERKERLSDLPFLDGIMRRLRSVQGIQSLIRQAGVPFSTGAFVLFSLLLGALGFSLASLLRLDSFLPAIVAVLFTVPPFGYLVWKRAGRRKKFSDAFPDAISRMASSLRVGYSLQMALEAVVEDSGTLVAEEFKKVLAELELGQSFEDALKQMLERIDTPELRLFISAVLIQKESGGNLAELLDNLESTIRQRLELQRELVAATAQARFSGLILSLLPIVVGLFVFAIHRNYILFLFEDPVGKQLLWTCVVGQLLGFYSIHRIVHIRI